MASLLAGTGLDRQSFVFRTALNSRRFWKHSSWFVLHVDQMAVCQGDNVPPNVFYGNTGDRGGHVSAEN